MPPYVSQQERLEKRTHIWKDSSLLFNLRFHSLKEGNAFGTDALKTLCVYSVLAPANKGIIKNDISFLKLNKTENKKAILLVFKKYL